MKGIDRDAADEWRASAAQLVSERERQLPEAVEQAERVLVLLEAGDRYDDRGRRTLAVELLLAHLLRTLPIGTLRSAVLHARECLLDADTTSLSDRYDALHAVVAGELQRKLFEGVP